MRLANSELYWLLLALPLFYIFGRIAYSKRLQKLEQSIDCRLLPALIKEGKAPQTVYQRTLCWTTVILLCLVFALLRPQWGFLWKDSSNQRVDIVFAVDISESMLAEDVQPNRLIRAQREALDLLSRMRGNRVSLVLFAGTHSIEMPLTLDYKAIILALSSLSTELIPIKGSSIESAVRGSMKTFYRNRNNAPPSDKTRAIILFTDGEDFEDGIEKARALAIEKEIPLHILGIGSTEGGPIPIAGKHKRDAAGRLVISRLQEDELQYLARETGGVYVRSIAADQDSQTLHNLVIRKKLSSNEKSLGRAKHWNEYFQLPLLAGILLLLIGPWGNLSRLFSAGFSRKGSPVQIRTSIFLALCIAPFIVDTTQAQSLETLGAEAKHALQNGQIEEAMSKFSRAAEKSPSDYRFKIGQGASLYRKGEYTKAKDMYFEAAELAAKNTAKAQSLYNAANCMVQLGDLKEAIKAYEQSLKLLPDDKEAKDNLDYTQRLLDQRQYDQKTGKRDPAQTLRQKVGADSQNMRPPEKQRGTTKDSLTSTAKERDSTKTEEKGESKQEYETNLQSRNVGKDLKPSERQDQGEQSKINKQQRIIAHTKAPSFDQHEALLETIHEKPTARMKYRLRLGMQQLEEENRKAPGKDW